jgi:hypothetical protein
MALHCDANEMLARAKDLLARGRCKEAHALAIDAAAVFDHSGDLEGAAAARSFAALAQTHRNDAPPG